jgi:predicted MPP superfamily phosphohydrolase
MLNIWIQFLLPSLHSSLPFFLVLGIHSKASTESFSYAPVLRYSFLNGRQGPNKLTDTGNLKEAKTILEKRT